MARMAIFVALFPAWKCLGQVGAVVVECEHWDGGRSVVLPGPVGAGQIFSICVSKGPF